MNIELENTFTTAIRSNINLFLGSGFSTLASDKDGNPLPTSDQLAFELVKVFGAADLSKLPLDKLSTILKARQLDQFNEFLKKRFTVGNYDPAYNILNSIKLSSIITTNIDDLITKVLSVNPIYYLNNVTMRGSAALDKTAINYIPLHGNVNDEKPDFIFSATELATAFSMDRDKWHYLTHALQDKPTVFLGYGMQDSGVLEALHPNTTSHRAKEIMWIMLREHDEATEAYYRALGFNIIIGGIQEFLAYLKDLILPADTIPAPLPTSRQLFPRYQIPDPTKVPQRPLTRFYGGEPPIWADIFSGRICRTKFYRTVEDTINAKKNIIVTGLAASGKTTLMMQLAASITTPGQKLVCSDLTFEKAELLVRYLRSETALVFVDNFADDIDAFNLLLRASHITAIGFERDYNFEIASHRLDEQSYELINITDLNKDDVQSIFSSIPVELRKRYLTLPEETEENPSLFEIIQLNITLPKLQERFSSVLEHLESSNPTLVDILVMLAYVHSCRTPVSFEMILAFLRNVTTDYKEVYKLIRKLGEMVAESADVNILAEQEQDYFIPRSTIVAEAIISQAPSIILKRVLLTFHNEVSSYRIFRYDVFKKRAYDASIMKKAFFDWAEGKAFYEKAFRSDPSPYIRQQGALYLSKMRMYPEAFAWIDEALILSRFKVFSIRNSHAIILFKANIDKSIDDVTVRETLDQSMAILSECHSNDKRKLYHALTFADQAIRYYDKFGDGQAKEYLVTAKKWLTEERRDISHRGIERLLKQINTILARFSC